MARHIFLHIGHPKTGSSALQTAFARGALQLADAGLVYLFHRANRRAEVGTVTSGNIDLRTDWLWEQVAKRSREVSDIQATLFSSEVIYPQIPNRLSELAELNAQTPVTIILCVRDPFETVQSQYQQAVKNGGETRGIDKFSESENNITIAAAIARGCESHGIGLHLVNYGLHKRNLLLKVLEPVGLDPSVIDQMTAAISTGTINRSLTLAEHAFVREANRQIGRRAGIAISGALIHELPDVRADKIALSDASLKHLEERLKPDLEVVNTYLGPEEQLTFGGDSHASKTRSDLGLGLSAEQSAVIIGAIKRFFAPKPTVGARRSRRK